MGIVDNRFCIAITITAGVSLAVPLSYYCNLTMKFGNLHNVEHCNQFLYSKAIMNRVAMQNRLTPGSEITEYEQ